ncbi:hypothetical protein Nepgr_021398 [Nepenthes gracilis]|uniref:Uncharacterized protein n=1 Tax=Nepenthes gracilis TaxID=150966 RepID=A0AAD3XVX0_NEPGR|nr:hypothetical protein Nepgr_021398 [Nepenthes gracilis]
MAMKLDVGDTAKLGKERVVIFSWAGKKLQERSGKQNTGEVPGKVTHFALRCFPERGIGNLTSSPVSKGL